MGKGQTKVWGRKMGKEQTKVWGRKMDRPRVVLKRHTYRLVTHDFAQAKNGTLDEVLTS